MNQRSASDRLSPVTAGFTLAAAIAVVFNTALAWAKDAWAPLNTFMASLTGHHWTTHGLADLLVFLTLGFLFARTKIGEKLNPDHLRRGLIAAVTIAALGLILWFLLV